VTAARWAGPDHDEAMELWNRVPEGSRAGDPPAVNALPKGIIIGDGVVKSVTCKDLDFTIVEESEGKTLTFHRKGFPVGFSDTLLGRARPLHSLLPRGRITGAGEIQSEHR
jgi:hypothetical protein